MRLFLRSFFAFVLAFAFETVAPLVAAAPAHAQSCTALKAQLAAATSGGNRTQYRRFDNALKRQKSEISRARSLFRGSCGNRSGTAQCRNLENTISRMRANVSKLQAQRDRHAGRQISRSQRRRLETRIDRACKSRNVTVVARRDTTRQKPRQAVVSPRRPSNVRVAPQPQIGFPVGGYRTLCVREADGYYFPISFSTTRANFGRDAAICQAMCPATQVRLFTHDAGDDEGVANMVSLDGEAYAATPTAFKYRFQGRNKASICGKPDLHKLRELGYIQRGDKITGVDEATEVKVQYPLPPKRPDRYADPETIANAASALTPARIGELASRPAAGETLEVSEAGADVRVVLQELLPDPTTAIDLEAPAPAAFR
ncbi:MAG: DUF2865 domain-containing protein [Pseudomonadota bacterium]